MRKPQRSVLSAWRVLLVLFAAIPAFFTSLLFPAGSRLWLAGTLIWVVLFLFFYLYYLPMRYKNLSYRFTGDRLELNSGVFYRRTRSMPLSGVQFVSLVVSPLDAHWNMAMLVVTAAGGKLRLPGLPRQEAEQLAKLFPGGAK